MEKSIKMSEDTWKKLNKIKYEQGASSLDEVVQALIKIVNKIKLASEIKENKK